MYEFRCDYCNAYFETGDFDLSYCSQECEDNHIEQMKCRCGSGKERYILNDARGISCGYVCEKCEAKVKSKYRPEVFIDGSYYADEQIEDDY